MAIQLGSTAWAVRKVSGGLITSYEWLNEEPCLCVYPEAKTRSRHAGALVVPLSCAHQWATSDGYPDLMHAVPVAVQAADTMGLSISRTLVRHIIDAVVDGLPDLLRMPKQPFAIQPEQQPVGEISIRLDGDVVHEAEIGA